MDLLAVQPRTAASLGAEEFVLHGVIDDAGNDAVALGDRDRHAEMRNAPGEIGRAVDRVDIDDRGVRTALSVAHLFLPLNCIGRKCARHLVDDDPFDGDIDLRLIVAGCLVDHFARRASPERLARGFACLEGGFGKYEKAGRGCRRQARGGRRQFHDTIRVMAGDDGQFCHSHYKCA